MTLRLARGIRRGTTKNLTAADVMKSNPKSIGHTASARDAANFFCANAIQTVPVIDDAGRPIGVVNRTDLLEYWGCRRDQLWTLVNGELACNSTNAGIYHGVPDPTVVQIMTPVVFCVRIGAPIRKVVEKILALEIRCLFVTDENGVLVGVISVFDLLRSAAGPAGKGVLVRPRPLKRASSLAPY